MADMQHIELIIKRQKWGWIGHTLQKDESSVAWQAMQWNSLDGIGGRKGRPCETWRRTVERQCKNLSKTWSDLKQLAQTRVRCRVGWCPMSRSGSSKLGRRNLFLTITWRNVYTIGIFKKIKWNFIIRKKISNVHWNHFVKHQCNGQDLMKVLDCFGFVFFVLLFLTCRALFVTLVSVGSTQDMFIFVRKI